MKSTIYLTLLTAGILTSTTHCADEPKRAGPDWWSFQKLTRPETPKFPQSGWVKSPIDAFILDALETKGLAPARKASKLALIRRATFDLIGLPPTPAEIDDFLTDNTADAFAKMIDRLLASPHYGERWGRHWLDVARFAESHGFERDQPRDHSWRYRDWVIDSFNDDKPYADFVREQVAGDVLHSTQSDGIVATGFLVAGPWDQVGLNTASPSVRMRAREDELEDILAVVSQTFLGCTLNCARCHDHKFDPFPASDYYRLKAIFEGVHHGERPLPTSKQTQTRLAELARQQTIVIDLERKIAEIENRGRAKARGQEGKDLPRPLARWSFEQDARDQAGTMHGTLKGKAKIVDGQLVLNGRDAYLETAPIDRDIHEKTLEAWVSLANLEQRGGGVITLETKDGKLFDAIAYAERKPGSWLAGSDFYHRSRDLQGLNEQSKPDQLVHLALTYERSGRIRVYRNGEPYGEPYVVTGDHGSVTFKAGEARVLLGHRHTGGNAALLYGSIAEARLYDRPLTVEEVRTSFQAGCDRVSREQILKELTEEDRQELSRLDDKRKKVQLAKPESLAPPFAYAALIKPPGPTHLLKRGDPQLQEAIVTAGPPASISGPPGNFGLKSDAPEGERRKKFADWLVHLDNPLTWRVAANRVWQYHFGEGLVRTPNDFGFNGEPPSHPLLLDWLATELRDNGGHVKKLHRLIMLSAVYQQATQSDEKSTRLDADHRLLSRFPPRRLEAEAVRDAMLDVSGQLNRQVGGPSTRPFRIEVFNSTFYHLLDLDAPAYNRRSVYRMVINSARDPLLDVLDCPDPSVKTPRRSTTTTPLQALTLMNNSFVLRQAQYFADRVVKEAGDEPAARITLAYCLAFGRPPEKDEIDRAGAIAKEHGLRAVCWALLNANEFVYIR